MFFNLFSFQFEAYLNRSVRNAFTTKINSNELIFEFPFIDHYNDYATQIPSFIELETGKVRVISSNTTLDTGT